MEEPAAIYTSGILCQIAIEEGPDRVLSAIRIVDRIEVDLPTDLAPDMTVIAMQVSCFAILSFKSESPEDFDVIFTGVTPRGDRVKQTTFKIHTDGGIRGHQIAFRMNFDPRNIGLWWFEVAVNGLIALKMPLEIVRATDPDPSIPLEKQSPTQSLLR